MIRVLREKFDPMLNSYIFIFPTSAHTRPANKISRSESHSLLVRYLNQPVYSYRTKKQKSSSFCGPTIRCNENAAFDRRQEKPGKMTISGEPFRKNFRKSRKNISLHEIIDFELEKFFFSKNFLWMLANLPYLKNHHSMIISWCWPRDITTKISHREMFSYLRYLQHKKK